MSHGVGQPQDSCGLDMLPTQTSCLREPGAAPSHGPRASRWARLTPPLFSPLMPLCSPVCTDALLSADPRSPGGTASYTSPTLQEVHSKGPVGHAGWGPSHPAQLPVNRCDQLPRAEGTEPTGSGYVQVMLCSRLPQVLGAAREDTAALAFGLCPT